LATSEAVRGSALEEASVQAALAVGEAYLVVQGFSLMGFRAKGRLEEPQATSILAGQVEGPRLEG